MGAAHHHTWLVPSAPAHCQPRALANLAEKQPLSGIFPYCVSSDTNLLMGACFIAVLKLKVFLFNKKKKTTRTRFTSMHRVSRWYCGSMRYNSGLNPPQAQALL